MALLVPRFRYPGFARLGESGLESIDAIDTTLVPVVIVDDVRGIQSGGIVPSVGPPAPPTSGTGTVTVFNGDPSLSGFQSLIWTMTAFAAGADTTYHISFGRPMFIRDFLWVFASGTGAFQTGYPGIFLWAVMPPTLLSNFGPSWASNPGGGQSSSTQMIIANSGTPVASTNYSVHLSDGQVDHRDLTAGTPIANTDWPGQLLGTSATLNPIPWIRRQIPHFPFAGMTIRKFLGANADDVGRWQLFATTQ
jgi:hypothetical protein